MTTKVNSCVMRWLFLPVISSFLLMSTINLPRVYTRSVRSFIPGSAALYGIPCYNSYQEELFCNKLIHWCHIFVGWEDNHVDVYECCWDDTDDFDRSIVNVDLQMDVYKCMRECETIFKKLICNSTRIVETDSFISSDGQGNMTETSVGSDQEHSVTTRTVTRSISPPESQVDKNVIVGAARDEVENSGGGQEDNGSFNTINDQNQLFLVSPEVIEPGSGSAYVAPAPHAMRSFDGHEQGMGVVKGIEQEIPKVFAEIEYAVTDDMQAIQLLAASVTESDDGSINNDTMDVMFGINSDVGFQLNSTYSMGSNSSQI